MDILQSVPHGSECLIDLQQQTVVNNQSCLPLVVLFASAF